MTHASIFESFDAPSKEENDAAALRNESYASGYEAGLLAAKDKDGALHAELIQSLADLEFQYEEVRTEVTQSLRPFLETLATRVFPPFAGSSFIGQISAYLEHAALSELSGAVCVAVHPDQLPAVETAIARSSINVSVSSDPNLTTNAAWLRHESHEIRIDVDQLIADVSDILAAVDLPRTRNKTNG